MITYFPPQAPQHGPAPQRIQPVTSRTPARPLRARTPVYVRSANLSSPRLHGAPQPREHTPGATGDHGRTDPETESAGRGWWAAEAGRWMWAGPARARPGWASLICAARPG